LALVVEKQREWWITTMMQAGRASQAISQQF
jgi:hypothetical protein